MGLRILTIARTLPWHVRGGMEEAAWRLAVALAKDGNQVTVWTTSMDGVARAYDRDGVAVEELVYFDPKALRLPRHRWWTGFAAAVGSHYDQESPDPDIIHVHSRYAQALLSRASRPPIVMTVHGTARGDYQGGSKEKLRWEAGRYHPRRLGQWFLVQWSTSKERRELARVEALVPVSEFVKSHLAARAKTVEVIPNGIEPAGLALVKQEDARRLLGLDAKKEILLFLGRVERAKRIEALFECLPGKDRTLVIAGSGDDSERLVKIVTARGLGSQVVFKGKVSEDIKSLLYSAADVTCLPSLVEGQPITLLESLALGTPVATSKPWLPPDLLPFAGISLDVPRAVEQALAVGKRLDRGSTADFTRSNYGWSRIAALYEGLFGRVVEAHRLKQGRPALVEPAHA